MTLRGSVLLGRGSLLSGRSSLLSGWGSVLSGRGSVLSGRGSILSLWKRPERLLRLCWRVLLTREAIRIMSFTEWQSNWELLNFNHRLDCGKNGDRLEALTSFCHRLRCNLISLPYSLSVHTYILCIILYVPGTLNLGGTRIWSFTLGASLQQQEPWNGSTSLNFCNLTEDALSMSLMMVLFIVISLISKEILTYSFNISDSDELYSVTYNVFSITVVKLIR